MKGLIEGRIVHYVLAAGEVRPAIVVRAWDRDPDGGNGCANLQVFTDADNDRRFVREDEFSSRGLVNRVVWRTSVIYDESGALGTWHWPPKA